MAAINKDDLNALRWAGGLGHLWFVVSDNRSPDRTKPGVRFEANDLAGCKRHAEPGDRCYQQIGPKKYKLAYTVPAAEVVAK